MNRFLSLLFVLSSYLVHAQCTDCRSLEDALIDPLHVQSLTLKNQGLTSLPESISELSNLRFLDVSENDITESHLNKPLFELKTVNLSGNIPEPDVLLNLATNCPNLTSLDISHCHMAVLPPHSLVFKNLQQLNLSANKLAFLPVGMEVMTELRDLNLNDNKIVETYSVIGSFWKLHTLRIARNEKLNRSGLFNSLKASTTLNTLEVSYHSWKSNADAALQQLPISTIIIDSLVGKLPRGIVNNPSVRNITIGSTVNTDKLIDDLKKIPQLTDLTFDAAPIPADLYKVKQLKRLCIKNTQTANLTAIQKWDFLEELDVAASTMESVILEKLEQLLPTTKIIMAHEQPTEEMITNTLNAIAEVGAVTNRLLSNQENVITVQDINFNIPANAFVRSNGTIYNGPVNFRVKVYNDAVSMALEGAPMIYNNNGKQEIFASNGMIDVKATTNDGEELQTNPARPILVDMPNLQPDEAARLYFFDPTTNSWSDIDQKTRELSNDSLITRLMDSLNQTDLKKYISMQSIDRLFAVDFSKKRTDASVFYLRSYLPTNALIASKRDLYITRRLNVGKAISKEAWHIDTIMTPKLSQLLHTIDSSYSLSANRIKSSRFNFTTEPRIITQVHIEPDFKRDHYRLTFLYKDTLINLPVYLDGASTRRTLQQHQQFQQKLDRAQKADRKEDKRMSGREKALLSIYLEQNRSLLFRQTVAEAQGTPELRKRIQFRIPTFGLINCDHFVRSPKVNSFGLAKQLIDQQQQIYETPPTVRVVFPGNVAYLATSSSAIPVLEADKSIVLMELSETTLGVMVVGSKREANASIIHSIDKTDKSAEELRQLIFNLEQ